MLDVVHHLAHALPLTLAQFLERDAAEIALQGPTRASPDIANKLAVDRLAAAISTDIGGQDRPFQRDDGLKQRDLAWWPGQPVAALRAAHALDQPCFTQ